MCVAHCWSLCPYVTRSIRVSLISFSFAVYDVGSVITLCILSPLLL